MHYYSTKNRELKYGLREALMKGLAPDGGLFMPAGLPILERTQLDTLAEMDLTEIAVMLSGLLFGEDIPPENHHPGIQSVRARSARQWPDH